MSGAKMLAKSSAETLTQGNRQEWPKDRLAEARGIIADVAQHPDTLVLLACRVICTHTLDPFERTEALGFMQLLAASTPNASPSCGGGAS